MSITEAPSAAAVRLNIQGAMTLARAAELRGALLDVLRREESVIELDLSEVSELDSAGVQLLLVADKTAKASGKELQLVGQSEVVVRVLELLRLQTHFGATAFCFFDEDSP